MRLTHRVQKLEQAVGLTGSPSAMERLQRALNESSFRVTGREFDSIADNEAAIEQVIDDLQYSFTQKLPDADLTTLIVELELIASGAPRPGTSEWAPA